MGNYDFDPTKIAVPNGNFFAFPYSIEESDIVLITVPWDVTTSFRDGTYMGPKAIIAASGQMDIYDFNIQDAWKIRIATSPYSDELEERNKELKILSRKIIQSQEQDEPLETWATELAVINKACEGLNKMLFRKTVPLLKQKKLVGLVGGEHSIPLGFIQALGQFHSDFGILHIDAHADLRHGYEGFDYSHAAIMYHVSQCNFVSKIVQVAIRDVGNNEMQYAQNTDKIIQFPDALLRENSFNGITWRDQSEIIVAQLPEKVYISFDIDGLSPDACPSTGTPVPGGISYNQAVFLVETLLKSKRKIIGFDLCETAPDEYDAIIASHLLFRLALNMHQTNQ